MTPPLSDYQADQLDRLIDMAKRFPSQMQRGFASVYQQGVTEADVPEVYRDLRDAGAVTVTLSESVAWVRAVAE